MHKRWHAVLHRFDLAGVHQETKHFCAGVSADGEDKVIRSALKVLSEWLMDLRSIKYGDISVGLFKTEIDGRLFGLVDTSAPDEGIIQVTLWPNDLAFYPPWDGSYDT
jgi:formate hydrogenlyase regulatory protein HycA